MIKFQLFENAHIIDFGKIEMSKQNFVASGPKFTNFILYKVEWIVVENVVYRLSTY